MPEEGLGKSGNPTTFFMGMTFYTFHVYFEQIPNSVFLKNQMMLSFDRMSAVSLLRCKYFSRIFHNKKIFIPI
jgi:hypothetical protein